MAPTKPRLGPRQALSGRSASSPPPGSAGQNGDWAYAKIRDALVRGEIGPDEVIAEQALADRYQVSRTPVREALTRLEQDGLIVRTDRGMQVRARSPEEILDIYEIRIVLEIKAAELASERHRELDAVRLEHLRRVVEETGLADPAVAAKMNQGFHRAVWAASHNDSLIDLLERLNLHVARYAGTTLTFPGRKEQADVEHQAMLAAILAGDRLAAGEAARAHFTAARAVRLKLWAEGRDDA